MSIILFRKDINTEEEFEVAKKYFSVSASRVGLSNTTVIGRYSVLPYYPELEHDLKLQNSILINSYKQHRYIADFQYYYDIEDLTPKTYFDLSRIPENTALVVKGKTNSRKFQWDTMMFAKDKKRAMEITFDLQQDGLIYAQDIIYRKYIPLETLEVGINGLPFSNEWRFFCYKDKVLSYGYYWCIAERRGQIDNEAFKLVQEVCKRVEGKVNFFVVDVAKTEKGNWIVVEMNDSQMSGLSENDPNTLYKNLCQALKD